MYMGRGGEDPFEYAVDTFLHIYARQNVALDIAPVDREENPPMLWTGEAAPLVFCC